MLLLLCCKELDPFAEHMWGKGSPWRPGASATLTSSGNPHSRLFIEKGKVHLTSLGCRAGGEEHLHALMTQNMSKRNPYLWPCLARELVRVLFSKLGESL